MDYLVKKCGVLLTGPAPSCTAFGDTQVPSQPIPKRRMLAAPTTRL
jgi:hypothetical protein